jgi:hypothetical protein
MKNPFSKFVLLNKETLETQILQRVDDAITAHREARLGFDDQSPNFKNESNDPRELLFSQFFSKKKIKNKEVKDLLFATLENVPEVDLSFEELWAIQDACWVKYGTDTIVQGIVDSFVDYIIGTGIALETPIPNVTKALNDFRKVNQMFKREREIVKSSFLDGEYFFLLFFDKKKGDVILRKGHPRTIEAIETAPGDIEVPYSYKQRYSTYDDQGNPTTNFRARFINDFNYNDIMKLGFYTPGKHYKETIQNLTCIHLKFNDSDKLRGLPPLMRILKWIKIYENFMMDRMVLNHERSKVVWIKSILQRTKDAMNKAFRAPEGGTMLIEREGIKYRTESSKLDSSEAKEDALGLLYYIGSGIRYPLHILNQRTDQQVYASIRKADTPFVKMIESFQFLYSHYFEQIYRFVLQNLVSAGKLDKEYSYDSYSEESLILSINKINDGLYQGKNIEDIKNESQAILDVGKTSMKVKTIDLPISQDFTQIIWQDPKEMSDVLKIHQEIGIASKSTLSSKAGYNWKKELPRILTEKKLELELEKARMEVTTTPESKNVENKPKDKLKPIK